MFSPKFSDVFLPVCHCGQSDDWQIDPQGRLFCLRCKVYPTLEAVPEGHINDKKDQMLKGYFLLIRPKLFEESIKELRNRNANIYSPEDRATSGDFGGFEDLFKPSQSSQPNQKRKRKSRGTEGGERPSDASPSEGNDEADN